MNGALSAGSIFIKYGADRDDASLRRFKSDMRDMAEEARRAGAKVEGHNPAQALKKDTADLGTARRRFEAANREMATSARRAGDAVGAGYAHGANRAERELRGLERAARRTGSATRGYLKMGLASMGVLGFAAAVKTVVKAGIAGEASAAQFDAQLKASGITAEKTKTKITDLLAAQSDMSGFMRGNLRRSFLIALRTTGSWRKAVEMNNTAMDVARGRGMDVEQVQQMLARAYITGGASLRRFGVDVQKVTTSQDATRKKWDQLKESVGKLSIVQKEQMKVEMDQAKARDKQASAAAGMAKLNRQFAGQAEAYGNTAAGSIAKFQAAWAALIATVGKKVMPIVAPVMNKLTDGVKKLTEMVKNGTGPIGAFFKGIEDILNGSATAGEKIGVAMGKGIESALVEGVPRMARAMWSAFWNSGWLTKAVILSILIKKFGPVFKMFGGIAGRGFGMGGALGGLGRGPIPVLVTNPGFGAGGPGMPGGPGGKGGWRSWVGRAGGAAMMIPFAWMGGQAIGDATGSKKAGNILSWAGTGAAIGSAIPGIGTVAGAVTGAVAAGLAAAIGEFSKSKTIDEVATEWGNTLGKGLTQGAASALTNATRRVETERRKARNLLGGGTRPSAALNRSEIDLGHIASSALAKRLAAGPKYGNTVGRFMSEVTDKFKDLPARARQAGTLTILALARAMEQSGRLPAGATKQITDRMKDNWADVKEYIIKQGLDTQEGLARGIQRAKVAKASQQMINGLKRDWAGFPNLARMTGANAGHQLEVAMAFMGRKIKESTGSAREKAKADLADLRRAYNRLPDKVRDTADAHKRQSDRIAANAKHTTRETRKQMAYLRRGVEDQREPIGNALRSIGNAFKDAWGNIKSFWGGVGSTIKAAGGKVIRAILPGMATGGRIVGPRGHAVPIIAHTDEVILNRAQQQMVGTDAIAHALRRTNAPVLSVGGAYAGGGAGSSSPSRRPRRKKLEPNPTTPGRQRFDDNVLPLTLGLTRAEGTETPNDDMRFLRLLVAAYGRRSEAVSRLLRNPKNSRKRWPGMWRALMSEQAELAGALNDYRARLKDLGQAPEQLAMAVTAARTDLYASFGSNARVVGQAPIHTMNGPAAPAKTTTVNNYFTGPAPADPHAYSRSLAFELRSL